MAQIIPLNSDGSAIVTVNTAAGLYKFVTKYNTIDNVWILDIVSPDDVPMIQGIALVPGCQNLLKGYGDIFEGYSLEVYCVAGTENRSTNSLGFSAQVVLFSPDETSFNTYPDAFSQYPPDVYSNIDPNITFIFLRVLPATASIPKEGGYATVTVYCSAPWTATSDNAAISINPPNGNGGTTVVKLIAEENSTAADIAATITFTSYYRSENVAVTQPTTTDLISITPATQTFVAAGESIEFALTSNGSWTVSCDESYFSVSPASGTGNATLLVTATENTGALRTSTLTGTCGMATDTCALTQDALVVPDCVPNSGGDPASVCYNSRNYDYDSDDSNYYYYNLRPPESDPPVTIKFYHSGDQKWYTFTDAEITGVSCGDCP